MKKMADKGNKSAPNAVNGGILTGLTPACCLVTRVECTVIFSFTAEAIFFLDLLLRINDEHLYRRSF